MERGWMIDGGGAYVYIKSFCYGTFERKINEVESNSQFIANLNSKLIQTSNARHVSSYCNFNSSISDEI